MSASLPPDDCVACRAPFRANRELASLPRARRIAVDLTQARAWRICTRCGHWNLLGPEFAAATIAELRGRLPTLSAERTGYDAVGEVEVLQIAMHEDAPMASRLGLESRRQLATLHRLGNPIILTFVMIQLFTIGWQYFDTGGIQADTWLSLGGYVIGWALSGELTALVLRRRARPWVLGASIFALLVMAFVVTELVDTWRTPWIVMQLTLLFTAIMVATDTVFHGIHRVQTLEGGTLRLTPLVLRDAEIAVGPGGRGLVVHGLRGDQTVTGADVPTAVIALSADQWHGVVPAAVERGWLLARSRGDLAGLGRALDLARPDDAGRHLWRELPLDWRLAFQFAAVEAIGLPEEREKLREKIREAGEVARIAERLDAPS